MFDNSNTLGKVEQQSEVGKFLFDLNINANQLDELVEKLYNRLSPVINSSIKKDPMDISGGTPTCEISTRIRDTNIRLAEVKSHINTIIDSLCI